MTLTGQVCVAESVTVSLFSCLTVRLVRKAHLAIGGIATKFGSVEVLVPPGYRVSARGPLPAAVGITELGGLAWAAEGRRSANGTGPPRGPLEDWSGPDVGLTSESRVQVTLIRVAARPVCAGQRGLLCGERARQFKLSESNLRGLKGLVPLGMCAPRMALPRCASLRDQPACARTPSWVSPLESGSPFQPGPDPEK